LLSGITCSPDKSLPIEKGPPPVGGFPHPVTYMIRQTKAWSAPPGGDSVLSELSTSGGVVRFLQFHPTDHGAGRSGFFFFSPPLMPALVALFDS